MRGRSRRTYDSWLPLRLRWLVAAGATLDKWDARYRAILIALDTPPEERSPRQVALLREPSSRDDGEWWDAGIRVLAEMISQISQRPDDCDPQSIPPIGADAMWYAVRRWSEGRLARLGIEAAPGTPPHIAYVRAMGARSAPQLRVVGGTDVPPSP